MGACGNGFLAVFASLSHGAPCSKSCVSYEDSDTHMREAVRVCDCWAVPYCCKQLFH